MSVGGKVTEVIVKDDCVYVNTHDSHSECAVFVSRCDDSEKIKVGDDLWWQGHSAYWTPASREFLDKQLSKIGYSGVDRPTE